MAPRIFFHTFSMALYDKWDVKNGFAYVLQFFSLIFDGLGGVIYKFLEKSTVFEVIFDNDVCNGIENKGDVICVRGTCKVSVDLFCVLALV